ncbi:MAG: T9SS type A sorting domain-containing protein [Saprospiraceae bacterium]|nr:T9SS type A sorting domain-containing protein [Saprospiraceae bacterium]
MCCTILLQDYFIPKPDCPRLNYRNKNQESNLNAEVLRVFPNPSNTGIITLQSNQESILFELWSIDQKLILPHQILEKRKELDLRHLPSGLYFIKYLTPGEKMKVVKFILQH